MTPIPLYLAPMAGYTDAAFRTICIHYGATVVTTEMISAKGLWYGSEKTAELLTTWEEERPVVVQLFGREPELCADAAKTILDQMGASLRGFDLNMGCPAPKITGNGEGCALMREPEQAARVIHEVASAVPVPVTVKFRRGWSAQEENAVPFAKMCQESGAAGLTVHPRYRTQFYTGRAEWDVISQVTRAVSIPVVGNGDICSGEDALAMLEQTGCAGVMIGRASLGNPFIFQQVEAALLHVPYKAPTLIDRRDAALRHGESAVALKGEHGVVELRKHIPLYFHGVPGAASLRGRLARCETWEALKDLLIGEPLFQQEGGQLL